MGGVGFEALPGSTHEKRPGRAAPAVCAQLLGGAQVDGHQTLAVELSPNAEDEPRTVEILDVETERLATSKARDIEQADQDVCGVSQIPLSELAGGGHELANLGRCVEIRSDPLIVGTDQAFRYWLASGGLDHPQPGGERPDDAEAPRVSGKADIGALLCERQGVGNSDLFDTPFAEGLDEAYE